MKNNFGDIFSSIQKFTGYPINSVYLNVKSQNQLHLKFLRA